MFGAFAGRDCLIMDDICDGGGTFVLLAEYLLRHGAASVGLAVTHGIFTKGIDILFDAGISRIYTTDSFPQVPHDDLAVRTLDAILEISHEPAAADRCLQDGPHGTVPRRHGRGVQLLRGAQARQTTLFFGLQYILKQFLTRPVTPDNAQEFLHYFRQILGEPSDTVKHKVAALAELGYWPVEIRAVPEGTILDTRNILFSIRNTRPEFSWCVGFLESLLLKIWYPTTVATHSRQYRALVERFADETCVNRDHVPFQVHDFGYRGVSSEDTAAIGGASHLLSFHGSDTIIANWFLDAYYGAAGSVKGLSVPASEHSVMCSYGRDGEHAAFDACWSCTPRASSASSATPTTISAS